MPNALLRAVQAGAVDPEELRQLLASLSPGETLDPNELANVMGGPGTSQIDRGDQVSRGMDRQNALLRATYGDAGDQPSRAMDTQQMAQQAMMAQGDQPGRTMQRGPGSPLPRLQDLPTDQLRDLYHPNAGGFVRNETTGKTLFVNGQPNGISEEPYPQGGNSPMADLMAKFQGQRGAMPNPDLSGQGGPKIMPTSAGAGMMRVIGSGNGTTVDLGTEPDRQVSLDYSRGKIDIPGVGRAYYGKDGNAYVPNADGTKTKVLLGYDMQGSMALNKAAQERQLGQAQIEHTQAATQEIGAPKYQLTPEGDVFNQKTGQITSTGAQSGQTQRAMQKAAYTEGLKEVAQDEKGIENLANLEQAYKRFQELNQKVTTGRVSGAMNGLLALSNPERQEMEKIQSFLAMNNFKPGQGSMSNYERTLIKGGGPNLSNDVEANTDIITTHLALMQDARDRANFRQMYLQSHGNLMGAENQWQQYRQANPAVVQDPTNGRVITNPDRVNWMTYFQGGGSNQSATPMNVARPGAAPQVANASMALPVPASKSALIPGQSYRTARGVARWNGSAFEQ